LKRESKVLEIVRREAIGAGLPQPPLPELFSQWRRQKTMPLVHSALRVRASISSAFAVADGLQAIWAVTDLASRPKSAAVSLE
jgi:hypothetical protein